MCGAISQSGIWTWALCLAAQPVLQPVTAGLHSKQAFTTLSWGGAQEGSSLVPRGYSGSLATHRRAVCPGPGRTGGRPWCRTCGHTAQAGPRRHIGNTHPQTSSSLPLLFYAAWLFSWSFCPSPLKKGMLRSRIKNQIYFTWRNYTVLIPERHKQGQEHATLFCEAASGARC